MGAVREVVTGWEAGNEAQEEEERFVGLGS